MTQFYNITHNTAYKRGMPEIPRIAKGVVAKGLCPTCNTDRRVPRGDLQVQLGKTNARIWPDLLACGDYPCFVISERFLTAMRGIGIRVELGGRVDFVGPNESGLSLEDALQYFWVDGKRCQAGKMNFEASGFVDVHFCPDCGARDDDISGTYRRQHSVPLLPYVFEYDQNKKLDLFTTDISPTAFYCTERVVECARKHRLTNLSFTPTELCNAGWPAAIDYLGKQWPPRCPTRPGVDQTLDELVEQLRVSNKSYEARVAILALGKEAAGVIPKLTELLRDNSLHARREAALLLNNFVQMDVPLSLEAETAVREYRAQFQATLGYHADKSTHGGK